MIDRQEVAENSRRGFTAVQGMEETKITPISPIHRSSDRQQHSQPEGRPSFETFMNAAQSKLAKEEKKKALEDRIYQLKRQGRWGEAQELEVELAKLTQ